MQPSLTAASMLNRMAHLRPDGKLMARFLAAPTTRFLVLADDKPVINSNAGRTEASIRWFSRLDLEDVRLPVLDPVFLGTHHHMQDAVFAVSLDTHGAGLPPRLTPTVDLRSLATQAVMSSAELSLIGEAKSLFHWHRTTRCCGSCGARTISTDSGWKRECTACARPYFPRVDPVVIMLVTDGEHCVLARESRFPEKMVSAIAGFIEPGEDIEHAVRRETFEELGLEVDRSAFHSAQPWPFPHSLMIGCIAFAKVAPLRVDPQEIAAAQWFTRAEVRAMLDNNHPHGLWVPGRHAIAHFLISAFASGLTQIR